MFEDTPLGPCCWHAKNEETGPRLGPVNSAMLTGPTWQRTAARLSSATNISPRAETDYDNQESPQ